MTADTEASRLRVVAYVTVGLAAVAAQLVAFQAAVPEPDAGRAVADTTRTFAVFGLFGSLVVLTVVGHLVGRKRLPTWPAVGLLGAGGLVGLQLASQLVDLVGHSWGHLWAYNVTVLLWGTALCVVLLAAAAVLAYLDSDWWRVSLAAPFLLETGAHAVLLVGVFLQADALLDAATAIVLAAMG